MNDATANLYGNAPDKSATVLILVDVINDLEFPEGDQLLPWALEAAQNIVELKRRAKAVGIPVIYANDNLGRWRSDLSALTEHCLHDGVRGRRLAELLHPEKDDYFVLKPKHSAFYSTPLELLLKHLGAQTVVIVGFAGNICVLFTASDAYLRDLRVIVPVDCIASNTEEENNSALLLMHTILKADIRPASELNSEELAST